MNTMKMKIGLLGFWCLFPGITWGAAPMSNEQQVATVLAALYAIEHLKTNPQELPKEQLDAEVKRALKESRDLYSEDVWCAARLQQLEEAVRRRDEEVENFCPEVYAQFLNAKNSRNEE
jgi:hypothetical protein